jgi:HEAT repeat protein
MMNWNSLIQQSLIGIDPTVLGALIGVAGTLVCTLTGSLVSHHLQQRNKVKAVKEQERRQKEKEAEATKTTKERVQAYRDNLRTDPRIAYLQIIDMSQSLEVKSIYVRLRLYKEARSEYVIDKDYQDLLTVQSTHDPNASFIFNRKHLEHRASEALDPNVAISRYKHCVIVGDPGAGKTTLLKRLVMKSLDKELKGLPDLPLYIELKYFADPKNEYNDLLEFIVDKWAELYGFSKGEAQDYLAKELKSGNVLVLLDGLDETFIGEEAEETYTRVSKAIINFEDRYSLSPIVVTVRKADRPQGAVFERFTELEVLDFSPEDIQQFVSNWFTRNVGGQERAIDLNNKLKDNPRIHALAANPLLLSLITIVYEANPNLLDHHADLYRADLYKECVDTLLTKWDAKRNVNRRRQFRQNNLEVLLEEIALDFHMQRRLYFPKEELLGVIAGILPWMGLSKEQNTQILGEITNTNGLLKEQAKGWYGFLHLTFQEYFVAQKIANEDLSNKLLAYSDEPWWEEVILLSARYTKDASLFLRKLLQKNDKKPFEEIIFHTDLILAGHYMASSSCVKSTSLQDEITDRLFVTLKKTPYSLTRQQIISTLIEIHTQEVSNRLKGLLCDQQVDKNVQELTVDALEISGDSSIGSYLLDLLSDPLIAKDIRRCIAIKLGKLGDRSQIDELLKLLSDTKVDVDVRRNIAEALGLLGGKQVIDKLLNVLIKPNDWEVHTHIVDVLSKLGEATLAPTLRSLLANQEIDQQVRVPIIDALGNLNDLSGVPELLRLLVDPDTDKNERICIVNNLGKLGDDSIVPQLRQFQSEPEIDMEIRQCIAIVLVKLNDSSQVNDLLQLLCDSTISFGMRESAAIALAKLSDKSVIDRLLQLLPSSQVDINVKRCIVDTLGASGDQALRPALMRLFSNLSIDPDIRGHIAITLGILGERSIVPELLPLLSNRKVEVPVCQLIADNLGVFGERSQIPDMLQLVSDQNVDMNVRKHVADALSQIANDESTVRTLIELLQTSDIQDDIHRALWNVSRQARVSVVMTYEPSGKQLGIRKW